MNVTPELEHWTARFLKPIVFIVIALVGVGIYLAFTIPVSVFPSTNFPRIVVGVDNGVMPIDQMQVTITRPIEEAVNSVPGLDHVRSVTSRGSAQIDLFFVWNLDMFQTLQSVNAALNSIQSSLPATARVTASRSTFAAFPIMGYSLTSQTVPQTRLWELATYIIKPQLNRLPGVAIVTVQGGQEPEFHITADPGKLVQTQVTVPNILDAVSKSNLVDSPGLFEQNHQLVLALVTGQPKTAADLAGIVVKTTPGGAPVLLGDIADINSSVKPVYTIVTADAVPSVLLNINRQPDSNTVAVANAVHSRIAEITKTLPAGVTVKPFYDQSELVNDSINSVRDAIFIGLVLAAIILVLFLRDWGSSLVAGLVIPATIAITFVALRQLGESFNLMTLGGLAAAVGLVIDDAIVVVENIVLHRDSGQSRGDAIRSALREIRVPLIGSTITPIVVFLPLITITGVTGTFFRALAITIGVALLTSLGLALTWTPALSHVLLRQRNGSVVIHESPATGWMGSLTRAYERVMRRALAAPLLLTFFCAVLIGASWLCFRTLGTDLLPVMDEGGFILDYLMPAGSSLADTNRVINGVEQILRQVPEVDSTSRRTGLQLGLAAVTEANSGDITVRLKHSRSRSGEDIITDVRGLVNGRYPTLDTDFIQVLQDQIGDLSSSPDPIEIKLYSQDFELLKQWGPKIGAALKTVAGVKDVKNGIENTVSGPAVFFDIDQSVTARSGFTPQEVELDASAIFQGEPVPLPLVLNDRPYTMRVRFPPESSRSLDAISNILLVSATGKTATLGSLATIRTEGGQNEIRRENLQRDIAVTARLEGISLGEGVRRVQEKVASLHVPQSIRTEYGGTYQEQQRSFQDLLLVLGLAVVLVFVVLLIEFGDFAAPVAIVVSALLSTSGAFFALLVTNTTFNISSFMGLIMVIGIVSKNGILLLDADQKFRKEGATPREAMIQAGERRLRPILMTALATVAGMIPLSLAIGAGSQMLQPLAIAVIGGIAASMVLSLVITPAANYFLRNQKRRTMKRSLSFVFVMTACAFGAGNYSVVSRFPVPGSGGWDYVTADSENHRLYISHETRVEVIDSNNGKFIGAVTDTPGVHGIAIANEYGRGFTSNGRENKVSIFNLGDLHLIEKIDVGDGPDGIYYDPASHRVFTNNHGTHDLTAIDAKSGKVVGTVKAEGDGEQAVIGRNGLIYLNLEDKAEVLVFDPKTLEVKNRFPITKGKTPTGLGMDKQNYRLFIACRSKSLVVMDASNGKEINSFPIGGNVDWAEFDPETHTLFTSNGEGSLSVIHQKSADEYDAPITVPTQASAKTMAFDTKLKKLFLPAAEIEIIPASGAQKAQRKMKPDSFVVLVVPTK